MRRFLDIYFLLWVRIESHLMNCLCHVTLSREWRNLNWMLMMLAGSWHQCMRGKGYPLQLPSLSLSPVSSMEQMRVFAAFHHLHPPPCPAPVMCKTKAARVSRVDTTLLHTHQHATHPPRWYFSNILIIYISKKIIRKNKKKLRVIDSKNLKLFLDCSYFLNCFY